MTEPGGSTNEREAEEARRRSQKHIADTAAATEGLTDAMRRVADLLATPLKQERAIEIWERLWHEHVPAVAERAKELATAVDELERPMTPEELAEIAPVLKQVAETLGAVTSDKAPNPQIVAIYYLRRIDEKLTDLSADLNTHFRLRS